MSETVAFEFSVGRVLSKSFRVLIQNPLLLLGLTLVMVAPGLYGYYLMATGPQGEAVFSNSFWFSTLIGILLYPAFLIVILTATAASLRDEAVSTDLLLGALAKHILPVLAIVILFTIAVYIGALFLIIPAIIIGCMFYVTIPARLNEGSGIIDSFGRSRDLTRGHRWGIFGLMLVMIAFQIVVNLVFGVFAFTSMYAAATINASELQMPWISLALAQFFSSIMYVYFFVTTGVAYHELRMEKEGGDTDTLAKVFA